MVSEKMDVVQWLGTVSVQYTLPPLKFPGGNDELQETLKGGGVIYLVAPYSALVHLLLLFSPLWLFTNN
jgi:hypothetical protein